MSIFVVDVMRDVVGAVSTALTPSLQSIDSNITGVHYEHGHPLEVIETLAQKDATDQYYLEKYPLIAVFQDFRERFGNNAGYYTDVSLNIVICNATLPEYKAGERYDKNFRPILYPIYEELMEQIRLEPRIMTYGFDTMRYDKYDRLYWGRQGLYGNEGNIFNDWLDAIEIQNLELRINNINCKN